MGNGAVCLAPAAWRWSPLANREIHLLPPAAGLLINLYIIH